MRPSQGKAWQEFLRRKQPGDIMLDRALFVAALPLLCGVLNVGLASSRVLMIAYIEQVVMVESLILLLLWLRAAYSLAMGWKHPSSEIQRFASLGALFLSAWTYSILLTITSAMTSE